MVIVMSPKDRFFCPSIHGHDSMAKINWGWSDHHVTSVPQEPILQVLPKSAIVTVSKIARTNARVGSRGTSEIHIGTVSKLSANYWRWPKNHPNDLNFMELHPLKTLTLEFSPPLLQKKEGLVGLAFFSLETWPFFRFGSLQPMMDFTSSNQRHKGFPTTFSDQKTVHTYHRYSGGDMKMNMLALKSCCIYLSIINIHMYYIDWTNFKNK